MERGGTSHLYSAISLLNRLYFQGKDILKTTHTHCLTNIYRSYLEAKCTSFLSTTILQGNLCSSHSFHLPMHTNPSYLHIPQCVCVCVGTGSMATETAFRMIHLDATLHCNKVKYTLTHTHTMFPIRRQKSI